MNSIRYLPSLFLLIAAVYFGYIDEHGESPLETPQPEPVIESTSYIRQLTSSAFDDIVLDEKRDAFVMFYAPWCGHCRSFGPAYEKVGRTFAGDSESLVLAKIDLEAEEGGQEIAGRYKIRGYPTLMWFPKGNKNGVAYEGSREATELIQFLNQNGGYRRVLGGELEPLDGTSEALNEIARNFMRSGDVAHRAEILNGLHTSDAAADHIRRTYEKVMRRVLEKGDEYITSEKARVESLLSNKASLSFPKQDELRRKLNVLEGFTL